MGTLRFKSCVVTLGLLVSAAPWAEPIDASLDPDVGEFRVFCQPDAEYFNRTLEDLGRSRDLEKFTIKGPYCIGGGRLESGRRLGLFLSVQLHKKKRAIATAFSFTRDAGVFNDVYVVEPDGHDRWVIRVFSKDLVPEPQFDSCCLPPPFGDGCPCPPPKIYLSTKTIVRSQATDRAVVFYDDMGRVVAMFETGSSPR